MEICATRIATTKRSHRATTFYLLRSSLQHRTGWISDPEETARYSLSSIPHIDVKTGALEERIGGIYFAVPARLASSYWVGRVTLARLTRTYFQGRPEYLLKSACAMAINLAFFGHLFPNRVLGFSFPSTSACTFPPSWCVQSRGAPPNLSQRPGNFSSRATVDASTSEV